MMQMKKLKIVGIAIVALTVAVILVVGNKPDPKEPDSASPKNEPPTKVVEARQLQETGKYCDARQAWETLLAEYPDDGTSASAALREESRLRLQQLTTLCPPSRSKSEPTLTREVDIAPPADPPAEIPEKELLDYYPVGREVQSVSDLNITGRGSNSNWGIKRDAYFAYVYRVVAETKVVENQKNNFQMVVFHVRFLDVEQMRATAKFELELDPPEIPLFLNTVFKMAEQNLLDLVPGYRLFKTINEIDPKFRATLTTLAPKIAKLLQSIGVETSQGAELEIARKIELLNGMEFQFAYQNGLGITNAKILKGPDLPEDLLVQIANSSGNLVDYFIFPAAKEKQVGDEWVVRAEDVAPIFPSPGLNRRIDGQVTLKRNKNETLAGKSVAVLEVVDGEIIVETTEDGQVSHSRANPKKAKIWFDETDLVIRKATADLTGNHEWESRDHLLFKTRSVGNLSVRVYYESGRVPRGEN